MEHDLGIPVPRCDPVDPLQHVLAVRPAHADIIPFALPAAPKIGQQRVPALQAVVGGQGGHGGVAASIAVHGNHPKMRGRIGDHGFPAELQPVRGLKLHRFHGGFLHPVLGLLGLLLPVLDDALGGLFGQGGFRRDIL